MMQNNNDSSPTYPKKAKPVNQHEKLRACLVELLGNELSAELANDLPKKWKVADDLLILPPQCFQLPDWKNTNVNIWPRVADCFRVKRIAQENRVKADDFRSPNLHLIYGDDPVVNVTNNGVVYSYDITKCMFSWGNITEKLRIADFDCSNETVVDLYAGFFFRTLCMIFCCWSISKFYFQASATLRWSIWFMPKQEKWSHANGIPIRCELLNTISYWTSAKIDARCTRATIELFVHPIVPIVSTWASYPAVSRVGRLRVERFAWTRAARFTFTAMWTFSELNSTKMEKNSNEWHGIDGQIMRATK